METYSDYIYFQWWLSWFTWKNAYSAFFSANNILNRKTNSIYLFLWKQKEFNVVFSYETILRSWPGLIFFQGTYIIHKIFKKKRQMMKSQHWIKYFLNQTNIKLSSLFREVCFFKLKTHRRFTETKNYSRKKIINKKS